MGLSERKVKQKINADPRNLAWAENAAKFGHTYLAKHGWAPGAGLGTSGDGRVSHIAIAQKLDQLGIGAGRPDGPDTIAWKQAKEFEGLLERLNAANGGGESVEEEQVEEEKERVEDATEDRARRKERKREEKRKAKIAALEESNDSTPPTPTHELAPVAAPAPRRLAHRARFLAAKRLAGTSSTALSEILGVSSTPASTSSPSTPATPALTAIPVLDDSNRITTSSQSVADYFKSKLRERAQATTASVPIVTFEEPEIDAAARVGLGSCRQAQEEAEDQVARPMGLGFTSTSPSVGIGFKRASSPLLATTPTPESHIPTPENTLDKKARKEKKRKRKEQATAAEALAAVKENDQDQDQDQDLKAVKRARKEAKRAARHRKEQGQIEAEESNIDQPLAKKKKKQKGNGADSIVESALPV